MIESTLVVDTTMYLSDARSLSTPWKGLRLLALWRNRSIRPASRYSICRALWSRPCLARFALAFELMVRPRPPFAL